MPSLQHLLLFSLLYYFYVALITFTYTLYVLSSVCLSPLECKPLRTEHFVSFTIPVVSVVPGTVLSTQWMPHKYMWNG